MTVAGVQSRQYYIVIEDEALLAMARVPRPRVLCGIFRRYNTTQYILTGSSGILSLLCWTMAIDLYTSENSRRDAEPALGQNILG